MAIQNEIPLEDKYAHEVYDTATKILDLCHKLFYDIRTADMSNEQIKKTLMAFEITMNDFPPECQERYGRLVNRLENKLNG